MAGQKRLAFSSALSMIGRMCSGSVPLILTSLAARSHGLVTGGTVAALLALPYLAAELADFQGQRDIARSGDGEGTGRALAYRAMVFAVIFPVASLVGTAIAPLPIILVYVSSGIWLVAANTYSGRALRLGDFYSLAAGPAVGLITAVMLSALMQRRWPTLLGYALAIHAGRVGELVVMISRGGMIYPRRFSWRAEWNRTKHLLFGSVATAAVARGLVPAVHVLVSPVAAGVLGISMQLLGAVALLPLAVATAAFRQAQGSRTPTEAMSHMRSSLQFAIRATALLMAPAVACAIWAAHQFLHYDAPWMLWTIGLVLGSAIVEPWVVFWTAALQITFRDRALFLAHAAGAVMLAVLTPMCAWAMGPIGLGIGVALTRVLVVPLIWAPKLDSAVWWNKRSLNAPRQYSTAGAIDASQQRGEDRGG
ncbi:MAG TPA: hypothetical protein VKB93_03500 [Thermoanaerobaculia bacterium]|nr:hypothetical protein [Thermoanaerobaculia bacterium]